MKGGFLLSSVGKESVCNAGDTGSIPGSGRSAGKGIGYPLQYSWASLVAQLVKNLPAMHKTWVQSLGCEDPLENGKASHSSILAWRTLQPMGSQRVRHNWTAFTFTCGGDRRSNNVSFVLEQYPGKLQIIELLKISQMWNVLQSFEVYSSPSEAYVHW